MRANTSTRLSQPHTTALMFIVTLLLCIALEAPLQASASLPFVAQDEESLQRRRDADAFIAAAARRHFAHKLPNGAVFEVAKREDRGAVRWPGRFCAFQNRVEPVFEVEYVAIDCTNEEVESSSGVPFKVTNLNKYISVWRSVVPLIPEGERWTIYTPWSLAYGATSRGMPPFCNFVFNVEMKRVTYGKVPHEQCRANLTEMLGYDPYVRDEKRRASNSAVAGEEGVADADVSEFDL